MVKICKICNKEYDAKRKDQKYCSKECLSESKFMHKKCSVCNGDFKTIHKDTQTCSKKCLAETLKNGINKECAECGKDTYVKQCHIKEHNFCSVQCQTKFFGKQRDTKGISICETCGLEFKQGRSDNSQKYCSYTCAHKAREDKVEVICVICGNTHTVSKYRELSAKTCSSECYSKYFSMVFDKHKDKRIANLKNKWETDIEYREIMLAKGKAMCGELHYLYDATITEDERQISRNYPEYREWRTSVYVKDNFTCQCCGQYGGELNAHHKENYKHNKDLRIDVDNGITLCDTCHKAFHSIYGKTDTTLEQTQEFIDYNSHSRLVTTTISHA